MVSCTIVSQSRNLSNNSSKNQHYNIDPVSRGRENTGDYFPSLYIDRGAADVNMAREITKRWFRGRGK